MATENTDLVFDKHDRAVGYLRGKSKVKAQILRGFRGIKYDPENPGSDPVVGRLTGFRKPISGGDTGRPGVEATVGEYVELACPTVDTTHGQDKQTVAAWATVRDGYKPRIRFVSDAEFASATARKGKGAEK